MSKEILWFGPGAKRQEGVGLACPPTRARHEGEGLD